MTLPYRLAILNIGFACFVIWSAWLGYFQFVFTHDKSHITYVIAGSFVWCVARVFWGKTDHLEEAEKQISGLGFIGSLTGLIMALLNVNEANMSSPDGLFHMGTGLLSGIGVAFCASLVSVICAQWIGLIGWLVKER